jgi:hypothetical protein
MNKRYALPFVIVSLTCVLTPAAPITAQSQEPPKVQIPQAGVSEVMTMEGKFVRAAYNNEGYVILGYQAANYSVGEEWLLLEVGMTVRERVSDYTLTRDRLSLETPDGTTLPLPTIEEHREGDTRAVQQRSKVQRDSINYFPPSAHQACALVFFPDLTSRALPRDDAELSSSRACVGRLYFKVPGGIKYGQYWLNVKFEKSLIRVPFRILTKEEEKTLSKHYGNIEKQVKEAFKPKKK